MAMIPDLVIAVLILGMTYALASEGLWGAALMFFNVLFAGLIAFNFYEPLAKLIDSTGVGWGFSDTLCLLVLFCVSVLLLRLTTESLAPAMVRYPAPVYHLGRWFFALAASVVTLSIIVLAFECAPVHKKIFGSIDYQKKPPFGFGIDRMWLGFFQQNTGLIFVTHVSGTRDPFGEFKDAKVFDPRAEWLLSHQLARPYGTESVLEAEGGGGGAAAGGEGQPAAGAAGGAPAAPGGGGMPGGQPGDPKVIGPGPGGGVVIPGPM